MLTQVTEARAKATSIHVDANDLRTERGDGLVRAQLAEVTTVSLRGLEALLTCHLDTR